MTGAPLAERMRPNSLDDVLGQQRWVGTDGALRRAVGQGRLFSMILWGPPGCGKTTLARIVADAVDAPFHQLSAVLDGVKALRPILESANRPLLASSHPPILFIDEIHRWNKAQQDALLPHVESGAIVVIGATTENPSFEVNAALRSRLRILRLEPLTTPEIAGLLERALVAADGLGRDDLTVDPKVLQRLAERAAGDARRALTDLEHATSNLAEGATFDLAAAAEALARADLRHDRSGDDHYDVLSAFIKSMRGSDPHAAVYWLARLLAAGEDPVAVARRLVVFAAEDVGNADPRALAVATDAAHAAKLIGMPEARIPLAQATTWLACAPKSNAAYLAINAAMDDVRRTGALPVPLHLRNAPTEAMKNEGFGAAYAYPHDHPNHIVRQQYLPDGISQTYYAPVDHGEERVLRKRLAWWEQKLAERS